MRTVRNSRHHKTMEDDTMDIHEAIVILEKESISNAKCVHCGAGCRQHCEGCEIGDAWKAVNDELNRIAALESELATLRANLVPHGFLHRTVNQLQRYADHQTKKCDLPKVSETVIILSRLRPISEKLSIALLTPPADAPREQSPDKPVLPETYDPILMKLKYLLETAYREIEDRDCEFIHVLEECVVAAQHPCPHCATLRADVVTLRADCADWAEGGLLNIITVLKHIDNMLALHPLAASTAPEPDKKTIPKLRPDQQWGDFECPTCTEGTGRCHNSDDPSRGSTDCPDCDGQGNRKGGGS